MIEHWANGLALSVSITALATLAWIVFTEVKESKKREQHYRGRQWEDDEGGDI